jgi:site-specific recombinase XerD
MNMKILAFRYLRESNETKDYEVLQLKDMDTAIEGISIHDLSKEEKEKIIAIQKQYEDALQPYMRNYRKFLKSKITQKFN